MTSNNTRRSSTNDVVLPDRPSNDCPFPPTFDGRCRRCGTKNLKLIRTEDVPNVEQPPGKMYTRTIYACRRGSECGVETKVIGTRDLAGAEA